MPSSFGRRLGENLLVEPRSQLRVCWLAVIVAWVTATSNQQIRELSDPSFTSFYHWYLSFDILADEMLIINAEEILRAWIEIHC